MDLDPVLAEQLDRRAQVPEPIADVRPEPEVAGLTPRPRARPLPRPSSARSRTTSTPTSSIASGIGGSGFAARTRTTSEPNRSISRSPITLAEPLERPVAALGRRQRDDVADLGVVDRVLEPVGEHRVAVGDVERDVDHQPLADLLLGVGDPVVGVDREPAQLDLDGRLDLRLAGRFHVAGSRQRVVRRQPRAPSITAATSSAWRSSATS